MEEKRVFGAKFSKRDVRDYRLYCAIPARELPEEYQLENLPDVLNQGSVGSCVAHALAETVQWHSKRQGDSHELMSTAFIYGNRMNSTWTGSGMYVRDAIDAVTKCGTCEKKYLSLNKEVPEAIKYFEENYYDLIDKARPFHFSQYARISSINDIKAAIIQYGPVVMAMNWYSDIYLDNKYIMHTSQDRSLLQGGHCMIIYGWTEDGWLVQNSWGINWGKNGRCIIPYNITISELYQVIDNFSENERRQRIEDLENENKKLNETIELLKNTYKQLEEKLDEYSKYEKLTKEQKQEIDSLKKQLTQLSNNIVAYETQIEKQRKEIELLEKELLDLKKPFDSKIGQFFAKIFNAILNVLDYLFKKR